MCTAYSLHVSAAVVRRAQGWKGFGSGRPARITIHERREGSRKEKPPQELHVWHTSTESPVSFSSRLALLQWFIHLLYQRFPGWRASVCGRRRAHVRVPASINCGVYGRVGGWICYCVRVLVCVCETINCKHRPEPVMRQGGRDSAATNANNLLLNEIQKPTHTHTLTLSHTADFPKEEQVPPNTPTGFWGNNYWFTTDLCKHQFYEKALFLSSLLCRHVAARPGDPDLSFHLLRSVQHSRPVGGNLLLSAGICRPVLWALRAGVHLGRPRQRTALSVCAVQLPPTWILPPRDG